MMKQFRGSYCSYFLMYFFYYLSLAMMQGLISVYLMDRGYSASQVSLTVSASLAASVALQPVVGALSDRLDKRLVCGGLLAINGILSYVFPMLSAFPLLAAVYSLMIAGMNGTNPAVEQMATVSRFPYGKIRVWGTIGYAVGTQVSGILYRYVSPGAMYQICGMGMVLCMAGLLGTQDVTAEDRPEKAAARDKEPGKGKMAFGKDFLWYLVITGLFYGATNVNSPFLPSMFQEQGMTIDLAATVIFAATLMEFPIVMFSGRLMDRMKNKTLLTAVFSLLVIQFAVYALVPFAPVQAAAAFLTKSVATMAYIMINLKVIASIVDKRYQMTALAVVAALKSLFTVGFQTVCGYLLDHGTYQRLYLLLLGVSVFGILLILASRIPDGTRERLFE